MGPVIVRAAGRLAAERGGYASREPCSYRGWRLVDCTAWNCWCLAERGGWDANLLARAWDVGIT
jgi:hypothetical protein